MYIKETKKMKCKTAMLVCGTCTWEYAKTSLAIPAKFSLLLVLEGGLLELLGGVSSSILLLGKLGLGSGKTVGLGGLLSSISAAAVGLGLSLFFLEAGNLLLGLLDVLCVDASVVGSHLI
jgi:hypothetical protein